MIGLPFLLLRFVVSLGFAAAGTVLLFRAGREHRYLRLLPAAFLLLAGLAVAAQLTIEFVNVLRLRRLTAEDLGAIEVGAAVIQERAALGDVAGCLATGTWFDGASGQPRDLVLVRRDGTRRSWRVAAHKRGAVVDFGLIHAGTGLRRGEAFVACLPEALRRHGAALE